MERVCRCWAIQLVGGVVWHRRLTKWSESSKDALPDAMELRVDSM